MAGKLFNEFTLPLALYLLLEEEETFADAPFIPSSPQFDYEKHSPALFKQDLRFKKPHIIQLCHLLDVPDQWDIGNRTAIGGMNANLNRFPFVANGYAGIDGFCLFLYRLASAAPLRQISSFAGYSISVISAEWCAQESS
jgi:hypothetical protein